MRTAFAIVGWIFSLALAFSGTTLNAQTDADAVLGSSTGWQRYDWLSPAGSGTTSSAEGGKLTSTASQAISDPFTMATNGALWQENYGATYVRPLTSNLTLSYETNAVTLNENSDSFNAPGNGTPDDLSHGQKAGLQLKPFSALTLTGNVHDSSDDAGSPADAIETRGGGMSLDAHLPPNSVLTLSGNTDTTTTGSLLNEAVTDNSCDAQIKQPLGKLPLTALVKGHLEETSTNSTETSSLPSMEQSLVWKANETTTVQMGLRQQQYQDFPGITNQLNETVFADWAQTLLPDITWHSYAEVLNSKGTADVAPAVPTTSGANGTPQSADPTNSLGMPTSITDESVTFSTGPSFKLDRDLSASVEYSNRIDKAADPGSVGQDQRVSVSLKGTF